MFVQKNQNQNNLDKQWLVVKLNEHYQYSDNNN